MIGNNNHTNVDDEVQKLISLIGNSPEDFDHLQVFLHRERPQDFIQNYEFLMVTPTIFGKIRLKNLRVDGNFVVLEIQDCSTLQFGNVSIDIYDTNPQTQFICWRDIRSMVLTETITKYMDDDLLDFFFEESQ